MRRWSLRSDMQTDPISKIISKSLVVTFVSYFSEAVAAAAVESGPGWVWSWVPGIWSLTSLEKASLKMEEGTRFWKV